MFVFWLSLHLVAFSIIRMLASEDASCVTKIKLFVSEVCTLVAGFRLAVCDLFVNRWRDALITYGVLQLGVAIAQTSQHLMLFAHSLMTESWLTMPVFVLFTAVWASDTQVVDATHNRRAPDLGTNAILQPMALGLSAVFIQSEGVAGNHAERVLPGCVSGRPGRVVLHLFSVSGTGRNCQHAAYSQGVAVFFFHLMSI